MAEWGTSRLRRSGFEVIRDTVLQIDVENVTAQAGDTTPERTADLRSSRNPLRPNNDLHSRGSLTLFPYQNPQGCHAARRMWGDAPSKVADVLVALRQSVVDVDGAVVGSDADAGAGGGAAAVVDGDDGDDDGGDGGQSTD